MATGKNVIVIGGGDTGSDCVGTSNRHGAKSVIQFELMPQPPEQENKELTWPYWPIKMRTSSSHEEGCEREFAIATKEFIGENGKVTAVKTVRVEFKDGKFNEVAGSEQILKADLVLLAMGFVNPVETMLTGFGVEKDARGNAKASTDIGGYKTNVAKVFAAALWCGPVGPPARPLFFPYHSMAGASAHRPIFLSMSANQFQLPDSVLPSRLPDTMVELRGVTCGYGDRIILQDINLVVPKGKVVALMGTSGGGKTTVLRLIGRQISPMQGQVLLDGRDIAELDANGLMAARRRMGMLFQFGALFTDLSVFDNVAFPLREHTKLPPALIRDLVLMKLNAVGLRGARDLMPSEISGGMGVAARLIRELNDTMGLTSIIVSHDVEETFLIADHVVLLANGRIVAQGSPVDMRASEDPLVRQFVHAAPDGPVRFHHPAQDAGTDYGVR